MWDEEEEDREDGGREGKGREGGEGRKLISHNWCGCMGVCPELVEA